MKNVIEILNAAGLVKGNNFEVYKLPRLVTNWPTVTDDDGDEEPLDLENYEIIKLNEKEMIMACGGDWQEPLTFTLVPDGDKLKVIDITTGFDNGLSDKEIIKILSKI